MYSLKNDSRLLISDSRFGVSWNLESGIWNYFIRKLSIYCMLTIACCLCLSTSYTQELTGVVSGLQHRYSSVDTVTGNFQQTYHAPGIDQVQSGVFWLKRPALMRWEYRNPDEQLFVADGQKSYLYVPADRQVTIQPLSAADLHNTPLEFLMGTGDIQKNFTYSWERESKPKIEHTVLIRLVPRATEPAFQSLVLELDSTSFDLRRVVVREPTGNTMEFVLSNVTTNEKIDKKKFKFSIPKGVEIIQLDP
jgi:outer membrane lipoprotein carrier protein